MNDEAQDALKAVLRAAVDAYEYEQFAEIRIWVDSEGDMRLIYVPQGAIQGGIAAPDVGRPLEQSRA
ncbi:MAG: hypothetical protein ACR2JC_19545 [Chloroflexota bacterium]